MSRGPGRMQRAVLAAVAEATDADGRPRWVSVDEVLDEAQPMTRSERESVRRAIRTLGRKGSVEVGDVRRRGEQGDRWQLAARTPLTPEQRVAELEGRAQETLNVARATPNHEVARRLFDRAIELLEEAKALRRGQK
jgi:hypothetical protein